MDFSYIIKILSCDILYLHACKYLIISRKLKSYYSVNILGTK